MVLYQSQLRDIVQRHTHGEKRVLTWRGWRKIKLLNKTAALHDICKAFAQEFDEQQQFLQDELAHLREQITSVSENSNAGLISGAPGYVFEELRVLFKVLEKKLAGQQTALPESTTNVLEKINTILARDCDEQLRIVDEAEKGSMKQMEKLQRHLVRMAKDLHFSEAEVARLRNELETTYDSGVASMYKTVQGLADTDAQANAKRDLLSKLFESNLELRKKLAG